MSKAVLISIQPKWCELIASGKKIIEVRKSCPSIETPFKCYIYQSKKSWVYNIYSKIADWQGKVLGEFVCDTIITDKTFGHNALFRAAACMSDAEAAVYCLNNEMYGWHISDLVIYEEPKDLSDFFYACNKRNGTDCSKCIDNRENKCKSITRPPQSWCYVEEIGV